MSFSHKLVAVMNEKIEPGILMNALAHICVGFGAALGKENLRLVDYRDLEGGVHPNISEMPFIVLKTNSNKIRSLRLAAQSHNVFYGDFTDTMTIGTSAEQIEKTSKIKEADLIYYGIVLYGDWEKVTQLTRKFSLWR